MKGFVFVSYRGGTGRTLALVNLANLLVRLGKNVAVVDLDTDAPGVLGKYGHSYFKNPELAEKGGVVDYRLQGSPPPARSRLLAIPDAKAGSPKILLLAPGFPRDGRYWDAVNGPSWRRVAAPTVEEAGIAKDFWGALREDLESLSPQPDYLLVDTPSGLRSLITMAGSGLANAAVALVTTEVDMHEATTVLLAAILLEKKDLELHLVEARYPEKVVRPESRETRLTELLLSLDPGIRPQITSVSAVQALLDLEARSTYFKVDPDEPVPPAGADVMSKRERLIPLAGLVQRNDLTHDYFLLAAKLFPEAIGWTSDHPILSDDRHAEVVEAVASRLEEQGTDFASHPSFKVFTLGQGGQMQNPHDATRNVSFRVDTICLLFAQLVGAEGPAEYAMERLRDAGETAGRAFGLRMPEDIWRNSPWPPPHKRLGEWCRFDSNVGFGKFDLAFYEEKASGAFGSVEVHVRDNFLVEGTRGAAYDLCPLLSGYIRGVSSELLSADVQVEHPPERCRKHSSIVACVFEVNSNPVTPRQP